MKLNDREKIMLLILGVVSVSALLFFFVLQPQREKLAERTGTRSEKLAQLAELKEEIGNDNKLSVEIVSLEDEINKKADGFFTKLTQEDIILLIEEITAEAKLKIPEIEFPENRVEEIILPDGEGEVEAEKEPATEGETPTPTEGEEEEQAKLELEVHSADLKYEGYYYSFLDFLKGISKYEKKIIVKDISVTKDEDGYLRGNVMLDFYSIENIIPDGESMYAWAPNLGYIVGDPFLQFGDYAANKEAPTKEDKEEKPADPTLDLFASILDKIENIGKDNNSDDIGFSNRGETIFGFERKDTMFFVGNNKDIKGIMELNKKEKTEGKSSLNFKYDFLEKRKNNVANISFNNNIVIKNQAEAISLAIKPLDKSEAVLGVVIRDREGIDYKLELTSDLDWNGWETVGVDLPIDINYPAIIERIYVETEDFYEKLTGSLLIDDMRLIYD